MAVQKGGGGSDSNMEMWVFLIVVIFILVFWALGELFWIYATAWKWLRISELWIASSITPDSFQNFTGWQFNEGLAFLKDTDPKEMTGSMVNGFDNIYVRFFNWLPGLYLAFMGAKAFMEADNISTIYGIENLLYKMSHAFPSNKRFLNFHPELTSLDYYQDDESTYEFSMAMTERQFGECKPPLGLMNEAKRDKRLNRPIWDGEDKFDDELCRLSFEKQVGPLYRGFNGMSEEEKKLFGMFRKQLLIRRDIALPIVQDYMTQILDDRLKSIGPTKIGNKNSKSKALPPPAVKVRLETASHSALIAELTSHIDQQINKEGASYRIRDVEMRKMIAVPKYKTLLQHVMADNKMSEHAFTYTGLMSMLELSREGATLPPSSFRWLKAKNRTLWYALNCIGKKTAFTESAGTFAHWLLEKEAGIPVPHAEVTEAIEALRHAIGLPSSHTKKSTMEQWN